VTYVICANASYSQVKLMKNLVMGGQSKGRYLGMDLVEPRIDFVQLAQGMGVRGKKVEKPDGLREALRSAMASDKPALVEVRIESIP
jgi:benzoylformate decarboxylase